MIKKKQDTTFFFIKKLHGLLIKLVYLPPYSPNLNIIERLWKWTKKKTLYATYYDNFECFKNAIDTTIQKANNEYKHEIEKLLTLKFQVF